jgi:hypothetical protein
LQAINAAGISPEENVLQHSQKLFGIQSEIRLPFDKLRGDLCASQDEPVETLNFQSSINFQTASELFQQEKTLRHNYSKTLILSSPQIFHNGFPSNPR